MSRFLSKRAIWIAIACILVVAIVYGFIPKATAVEFASVEVAPMEVIVEEEGMTRVIDRFLVTAPVSGFVRRIESEVGDTISEGEALVRIEPLRSQALNAQMRAEANARIAAAQSALRAAEEAVTAAEADAAFFAKELERVEGLVDSDAATPRELDVARSQAKRALAQRASAQFAAEVAQHNLEAAQTAIRFAGASGGGNPVTISSPVFGRVLAIHHESEGAVAMGTPLLEVGDPSRLEVVVDVLSQDATRLESGMAVRFERWGGGEESLEGVVRTVEPVGFTKYSALGVEEQRVWVVADFTSAHESWRRLGDQYRVIAEFIVWQADDILQVPSSALFKSTGGWHTFVVASGRVALRDVEVGQRSGLWAQVLSGLSDGETVVVHPPSVLEDGARVRER